MTGRAFLLSLALSVFGASPLLAHSSNAGTSATPSEAGSNPLESYSVLAGIAVTSDIGPAIAARYSVCPKLSLELGGTIPYSDQYDKSDTVSGANNQSWHGHIGSQSEIHATAYYTFYKEDRLSFAAGVGVSMMNVRDDFFAESVPTPGQVVTQSDTKTLWSPQLMLEGKYQITQHWALIADGGYTPYSGNSVTLEGQKLTMNVPALTAQALIELRL